MVGLNFPIFGSAGDKNHITVRFQIKSSPQTEIHTLSSPKTVSALFSTPWIFFKFSLLLCGADVLILKRFLGQIQNFLDRSYASDGLTQWFSELIWHFCQCFRMYGTYSRRSELSRTSHVAPVTDTTFWPKIKNKNFKKNDFSKIKFWKKMKIFFWKKGKISNGYAFKKKGKITMKWTF